MTDARPTEETKETYLWQAKLAQETKRYEDMALYMRLVAETGAPMTKDEDNMLATAYKHVLDAKRSAKRTLTSVEEQHTLLLQQPPGQERPEPGQVPDDDECRWKADAARRYGDRVDGEVRALCAEMLAVVAGRQASGQVSADPATCVFYWKLRADYNRYAAEAAAAEGPAYRAAAVAESRAAYELADGLARRELRPIDPVRLGLMLNRSVFLYQVCGERRLGREVAKGAFEDAAAEVDTIDEHAYDDVTLVMRLIRDNLSIWSEEEEEVVDDDDDDEPAACYESDGNDAAPPAPPLPLTDESPPAAR